MRLNWKAHSQNKVSTNMAEAISLFVTSCYVFNGEQVSG